MLAPPKEELMTGKGSQAQAKGFIALVSGKKEKVPVREEVQEVMCPGHLEAGGLVSTCNSMPRIAHLAAVAKFRVEGILLAVDGAAMRKC